MTNEERNLFDLLNHEMQGEGFILVQIIFPEETFFTVMNKGCGDTRIPQYEVSSIDSVYAWWEGYKYATGIT